VFAGAFPKLKHLQIDDGYFSLRTAGFFPSLEVIKIKGFLNPSPDDLLAEHQLESLKNFTISSNVNKEHRVEQLIG